MIFVKNVEEEGGDSHGLAQLEKVLQEAVIKGLMINLTTEEKRKSFCRDSGFTTNNAHEYSSNRLNGLKTTGPSLTTTYFDSLGTDCQDLLTEAILLGLRQCPEDTCMRAFPSTPDNETDYETFDDVHGARAEIVALLMKHFRMDTTDEEKKNWCFEMISVRLGILLPLHFDGINDPASDVSVQLKIEIPIDLLPRNQRTQALQLGYTTTVPAQVLIYSRAHVKRAANKINRLRTFMNPVVENKNSLSHGMARLQNIVGELILHKGERCYQAQLDGSEPLTVEKIATHSTSFLESQQSLRKLIVDPNPSVFAKTMGKHLASLSNKKNKERELNVCNFDSVLSPEFAELFQKSNKTMLLDDIKESYLLYKDIPVCEIMQTITEFLQSESKTIPDPNRTYHGPIIEYLASFDKTRYFSEFLHCWYDIVVNDFEKKDRRVTARDALGFVLFVAGNCNGQSSIAELIRLRSMKEALCFTTLMDKHGLTLYDCLRHMSEMSCWTTFGSCTMKRHQFTNPNFSFDSEAVYKYVNPIFKELRAHEGRASLGQRSMHTFVKLIGGEVNERNLLKSKMERKIYEGVTGLGPVTAHTFMHLSSLMGLIPLACYREATLSHDSGIKCGPSRFISRCTGVKDSTIINDIFCKLHKDLYDIFGDAITKSYLENLLCEANRILDYAIQKDGSGEGDKVLKKTPSAFAEFMFSHNLAGGIKDGIFIHKEQGPKDCIQKMFGYDGSSPPTLIMYSTTLEQSTGKLSTTSQFFSKFRCDPDAKQTDQKSTAPMTYWKWSAGEGGVLIISPTLVQSYQRT